MAQKLPYTVDPDDPRSPSREQWDLMTPEQRRQVIDSLPADVPIDLFMPEGDKHRKAKSGALSALDGFFRRIGRRVYRASELGVYYPGVRRFAHPAFVRRPAANRRRGHPETPSPPGSPV